MSEKHASSGLPCAWGTWWCRLPALGLLALVLWLLLALAQHVGIEGLAKREPKDLLHVVLAVLSLIAIVLFGVWFTGEITPDNRRRKLRQMAWFSYMFPLGVLLLVLTSFAFPRIFVKEDPSLTAFVVLEGCLRVPTGEKAPASMDCDKGGYQWLVSIGAGREGGRTPPPGTGDVPDTAIPVVTPAETDAGADGGAGAGVGGAGAGDERNRLPAHVVALRGGLVVPMYVVVVALLGGAVSMTRRVPEIQKQAWRYIEMDEARQAGKHDVTFDDSLYGDADGDADTARRPITIDFARERLIFQIMQVSSAPVIAMIAYYLFAPDGKALSIIIAFICGFASESVLVAIRRSADLLLDKVSGRNDPDAEPRPAAKPPAVAPAPANPAVGTADGSPGAPAPVPEPASVAPAPVAPASPPGR